MPRGSKRSYTSKQRRQAHHIEESEQKAGKSEQRAEQIAYATVNKQDRGGKQRGGGRGKTRSTSASGKGGRTAGRSTAGRSTSGRSTAGRSTASSRTASSRKGGRTAGRSTSSRRGTASKRGGRKG